MRIKLTLIVLTICTLASCSKKVASEGTVYSRHGQPMPNVLIQLNKYASKDAPINTVEVTTNSSGHFNINTTVSRNNTLGFSINGGDSGHYFKKNLTRDQITHYDMTLSYP
jgi:hypothetical protein